jgi:alpha-glucosidase
MDYTPGALRNANRNDFRKINERPMSQGTRGHQVACYVVYDEPLAMLCDSPSDYLKEEETLRFITLMPTEFDHTSVLSGKVGEWIVTMREKDGKYYVGGMTSWQERDVEVDLSFLPEGEWTCRLFRDGINADKVATDYVIENLTVKSSTRLGVHMAPGGGFAMIITGFAR